MFLNLINHLSQDMEVICLFWKHFSFPWLGRAKMDGKCMVLKLIKKCIIIYVIMVIPSNRAGGKEALL